MVHLTAIQPAAAAAVDTLCPCGASLSKAYGMRFITQRSHIHSPCLADLPGAALCDLLALHPLAIGARAANRSWSSHSPLFGLLHDPLAQSLQ